MEWQGREVNGTVSLRQLTDREWVEGLIEVAYKTRDTERIVYVLDKLRYLLSHRREIVVKEDARAVGKVLYTHKKMLVKCLYKVTDWKYLID